MKKRVLFVDDEANILQGLRRMLHPMRREWDMTFAEGGQAALEILAQGHFDVVVSDMRMPGMDGTQLLNHVMTQYPQTVRIILSGHSDWDIILGSIGSTHQFLAKPCDAEILKATVARACALRDFLGNETLKRVVSGMQSLPSLPTLYLEVVEEAESPHGSLEKIGRLIERDMAMTAKVLQLVNSAFFGLPRQVSSPMQAVSLLGIDTIKALILSAQVFGHLHLENTPSFSLDDLWHHSMAIAACAKRIAQSENCQRKLMNDMFMAGLLHDVGKLVLAANLPQQYEEALQGVQTEGLTDWQAEHAVLGTSHAEVGAYLLGLWGLPEPIVEAVTFHHTPSACADRSLSPLTAVHVANGLRPASGMQGTPAAEARLDEAYITQVGLVERLPVWREHCDMVLAERNRP
jgi:putative nucleotidyltransferase with HDIG domain